MDEIKKDVSVCQSCGIGSLLCEYFWDPSNNCPACPISSDNESCNQNQRNKDE